MKVEAAKATPKLTAPGITTSKAAVPPFSWPETCYHLTGAPAVHISAKCGALTGRPNVQQLQLCKRKECQLKAE